MKYRWSFRYCELFISEVFPEDMGEYVCKVSNKTGTVYTRTTLTVESKYIFELENIQSLAYFSTE